MQPKKSLGQNWLRSASALRALVAAADLTPSDTVLEIGPGEGVLTAALLAAGVSRVIAVEKDDRLVAYLRQKFASEIATDRFRLVHGDIRYFTLPDQDYKLVANLPYYLTGQIIRRFLTATKPPSLMILMLQKEVAERIVAKDGKESLLSISVKIFGQPQYLKTVPAGAFYPPPQVDSAILSIKHLQPSGSRTPFDQEKFFDLLHRGFAHKRKLLRRNLDCPVEILTACDINPRARAEDLTLKHWQCLNQKLSSR